MKHISESPGFDARKFPPRSSDPYAGGEFTKHGWFSMDDLVDARARKVKDANGVWVIQFPIGSDHYGTPIYREIPEWKMAEGQSGTSQVDE